MSGHSLAPLVAKLRDRGDPVSVEAADAICGLIVRAEEDARWQVRAGHAERRAQRIGEVSDERLAAIEKAIARLRVQTDLSTDAEAIRDIADDLEAIVQGAFAHQKGGRSVASNGYVLVKVGTDHHLADVRGYAYEHRLVAEKKLGRRLMPGEQVHHIDGNKQNNDPSNIEVAASPAHHRAEHRSARNRDRLRLPGQANKLIVCACGCGGRFPKFDRSGRPRRFISGHNARRLRG